MAADVGTHGPEEQESGTLWQLFIRSVVKDTPRWLRYLYFLRFSILLWLFPLILVLANSPTAARSLVSGIVTPVTTIQYLCVSFFLIAGSFVALMLARVVGINGGHRFKEAPPGPLTWLLSDNCARHEWIAPAASQLNNVIVFWYFIRNGTDEGVPTRNIVAGLAWGVLIAFLFWYAMTAVYYITYRPTRGAAGSLRLGKAAARTLLLPRAWLGLGSSVEKARFGDALEDADAPLPLNWVARLFPIPGYRWRPRGPLFEGHYFSLLAAFGFFALYGILWPLTAPVPVEFWSKCAIAVEIVGGVTVFVLVAMARVESASDAGALTTARRNLRIWKFILAVPILGFTVALPMVYEAGDAARFPILALVLILVISLSWMLGAIAFFADRFRIPVLTVVVLLLVLPRLFQWTGKNEEHYLSIATREGNSKLPTPGSILDRRIQLAKAAGLSGTNPGNTFVIVTSTGGGIHAAAWTAAILQHLEDRFGGTFHDHVLMLSTVSGGSAGLYTYLRELYGGANGGRPDYTRMRSEAMCSSLESVGWGLVYHDIPKAIFPFPYLGAPSPGIDDLKESPLGKDRTWGLRRGFARNLNDRYCRLPNDSTGIVSLAQVEADQRQNPDQYQALTLSAFDAMQGEHPFPAFSMNTTTVEDGARFLLANYRIERQAGSRLVPSPAESFLDVYGAEQFGTAGNMRYPDLPLATAAQMSATFPYVSSAATFPAVPQKRTVHFVDGGYYDNDGTASAIEFIRAALEGAKEFTLTAEPANGNPAKNARPGGGGRSSGDKLRILLVEIRNSTDTSSPNTPGQKSVASALALKDDTNGNCKTWNLGDQLTAPLRAFYSAGHGSVTDRNRNALVLLERAYKDQLILQHFVIDDRANSDENDSCVADKHPPTDPLNWSLTPKQQAEIGTSVEEYKDKYEQIWTCFAKGEACPNANQEASKP